MPPKEFICDKCGETVSKRKSVSIGEGKRICKIHQQANDILDEKRKQEKEKRDELSKPKKKYKYYSKDNTSLTQPQCMCCSKLGVIEQQYAINMIYAMNVAKRFNNITPQELLNSLPEENRTCIYTIDKSFLIGKKIWYKDFTTKQFVDMFGFAGMCYECIKKYNLQSAIERKNDLKDVSLDKLYMIGSIVSDSIQKEIDEVLAKNGF